MKDLKEYRAEYQQVLNTYNKQEAWIEKNQARVTTDILVAFTKTVEKLGNLGYEIEKTYGIMLSLEEKLGKCGPFQKEVVKQLGLANG